MTITLPPLARDDAIAMVEALARGRRAEGWTPALSAAVVDASAETWPIFLQCGFDAGEHTTAVETLARSAATWKETSEEVCELLAAASRLIAAQGQRQAFGIAKTGAPAQGLGSPRFRG